MSLILLDIKGQEWEEEWLNTYNDINESEETPSSPEQYEIYNLTLFHYNHPLLKSKLLDEKNSLKGINSEEYIKEIMKKIEREDLDDDDSYYK